MPFLNNEKGKVVTGTTWTASPKGQGRIISPQPEPRVRSGASQGRRHQEASEPTEHISTCDPVSLAVFPTQLNQHPRRTCQVSSKAQFSGVRGHGGVAIPIPCPGSVDAGEDRVTGGCRCQGQGWLPIRAPAPISSGFPHMGSYDPQGLTADHGQNEPHKPGDTANVFIQ